MNELNQENLLSFERRFFDTDEFQNQRYGQALCNHFNLLGDRWSELFYTEDFVTANSIIWQYVSYPD